MAVPSTSGTRTKFGAAGRRRDVGLVVDHPLGHRAPADLGEPDAPSLVGEQLEHRRHKLAARAVGPTNTRRGSPSRAVER